jgi:hypothetical protein
MRELINSLQRLEKAMVAFAVFDDGTLQVIHAGAYGQPANEVFTVWSAMDMFMYVMLPAAERSVFHHFKKLGGTVQWRAGNLVA